MTAFVTGLDWSEYEKRKSGDMYMFNASVPWERDFLCDKVHEAYSKFSKDEIMRAINETSELIGDVKKRSLFIECTLLRLKK